MSTRVRCTLNYGGMRYGTMHQVVQTATTLYRQQTGKYYLVKKGTTPLWKYLMEMVERIPDWPEGAKLKIWREKRGGARKRVVEVEPRPTTAIEVARRIIGGGARRATPLPTTEGHQVRFTRPGIFTGAGIIAEGLQWREEAPRAER